MILEIIATIAAGIFAGAAVYVSLVEHPARLSCGVQLAIMEWRPSYKRGTLMQAPLALIGSLSALMSWWLNREPAWLIGGLLLFAAILFTLVVIFPTNRKLEDENLEMSSAEAERLLRRWGRLHAVRSILGILAFVIFLLGSNTTARVANGNENAAPSDENMRIQWKLVVFTGLLVVAGFATAGVIFWQSWETRKAAEAARDNARAVINSERARIDGELRQHRIPGTGVVRCSLDLVNQGKTSAKIFAYTIKGRLLPEGADFSEQGMITYATEEMYVLISGGHPRTLRDDFDLDALTANADGIGRMALRVIVKYYDVVSEGMERQERKTSLTYVYDRLSSTLKRMAEYDEYT